MSKSKRTKDAITGAWTTDISGEFTMSKGSRRYTLSALYAYQNPDNPTTAYLGNEKNSNGCIDRDEVFGQYTINPAIPSSQDYPFPGSGVFTANARNGQFTMLMCTENYANGRIYNPSEFF
jgi:hypothetical protein